MVALIAYGGIKHFNQSVSKQDSILNADTTAAGVSHLNGYQLQALAPFEMHARVLSTKSYSSDRGADLAPIDLVLGWGPMADLVNTKQIKISQSNRWYHWRADHFPIPRKAIETHSANMHLIPSTPEIAKAIQSVKIGKMVRFTGDLVEASGANGWYWKSSLTREDTGAGACELVLVKTFNVL